MAKKSEAEPESEFTHFVLHPIRHDGKFYPRNSMITLTGEAAEQMEALGSARPIVDTEPAVEE